MEEISDPRKEPEISKQTILNSFILMLVLRWRSLLNCDRQFKLEENIAEILEAEKETVASDSTLSRALEWLDPEELKKLWAGVLKKLRRNKVHQGGTVGKLRVAAIDMSGVGSSREIDCSLCHGFLSKTHKVVFGYIVGEKPHLFLGFEPVNPGEGEVTAAERLLQWIHQITGNWIDVIVLDGLYKYAFIAKARAMGYHVVMKTDEQRLRIIQQAQQLFLYEVPEIVEKTKDNLHEIYVYDSAYTQTEHQLPYRILQVEKQHIFEGTSEIYWIITTLPIEKACTATIKKIARCRWHIENNAFHNLKTYWHFNHTLCHTDKATLNALWLRIIAFSFFMLFIFRHLFHLAKMLCDKKIMMVHLIPVLERSLAAPT